MWLEVVSVGIYVVFEESIGDRIERVSELSPPTPPERRHMRTNCPYSCGNVGSCFFCYRLYPLVAYGRTQQPAAISARAWCVVCRPAASLQMSRVMASRVKRERSPEPTQTQIEDTDQSTDPARNRPQQQQQQRQQQQQQQRQHQRLQQPAEQQEQKRHRVSAWGGWERYTASVTFGQLSKLYGNRRVFSAFCKPLKSGHTIDLAAWGMPPPRPRFNLIK